MTDGLSAVAGEAIRSMMAAGGWILSAVAPVRMLPHEDRYYRELPEGWVAVASVSYEDREQADDSGWRPGSRGAVTVWAGATFPAAERAMALFGSGLRNLSSSARPEFAAAGEEGEAQVADRAELLVVVQRAAVYLAEVALPWAREHANLTDWLDEMERHAQEDGQELPSLAGREIPAMLVALGRPDEALDRLARFEGELTAHRDPSQVGFARRLRASVADDGTLPEFGDELSDDELGGAAWVEVDPSLFEDAGRDAFLAAMERELRATPIWSQWKYTVGLALRGIRAVRELFDDAPTRRSFAGVRWRSVAYRPEHEGLLAAAFAGAGRPVANRVDLELTLRAAGDGAEGDAVEVVLGGRVVGRLTPADLHSDVEALSVGPAAARLTQKPQVPRYLLEVQLQRVP